MHYFQIEPNQFTHSPNLSLLYYKFIPCLDEATDLTNAVLMSKQKYLEQFIQMKPKVDVIQKRINSIKSFMSGVVVLENILPFLCGIGYTSSLEWGLSFDWTSGMPYLPGSSFKGSLLSYLEFFNLDIPDFTNFKSEDLVKYTIESKEWQDVKFKNGDTWTRTDVINVFGHQNDKIDKPARGSVAFFDVFPIDFKGFDISNITPHHKEYSEHHGVIPPGDTENPIPIPFLCLKPGSKFAFFYKLLDTEPAENLKSKIETLIRQTGENFGFGAKTTSGYGFFKYVSNQINL